MEKEKGKMPYSVIAAIVLFVFLTGAFIFGCVDVAKAEDASILDEGEISTKVARYAVFKVDNGYLAVTYNEQTDKYFKCAYYNTSMGAWCFECNSYSSFSDLNGVIDYLTGLLGSSGNGNIFNAKTQGYSSCEPIYSNYDLKNTDEAVVFQRTPCVAIQRTIAGGLTAEKIAQSLTAEWIGVIPLLLGLTILALSLWKGLASLWRLLATL